MSDDFDDPDIEIELTEEQAARSLTVGEFVELFGTLQNQITLLAMASVRLLDDDPSGSIEQLKEAYNLGAASARILKTIAENTWEPRDDG